MLSLLAAQARFPAAILEMQKAIALDPSDWDFYLNLALMQLRTSQAQAAEANFKKAIQLNPNAIDARLMLANYYQVRSRFTEAEQQLRDGMQADSKNPESATALARLYLAQGKKVEAEDFLKQATHNFPDNSAGYRLLGDFYLDVNDLDKATVEYRTLHQQHPKDLQVKENYIELLILTNQPQQARELDEDILKAYPNDNEALIYRGQLQTRAGEANSAIGTLQTVIKNDPNNGVAHYHLGVAFQKTGNLQGAESEWRVAVRLRPDLADAQRDLAILAMRRGDMSTLEQTATQIINLRPTLADGYALRAISEINRKQFMEAEKDVRKSIEVAPGNSAGYVQLGNLNFAQNRFKEGEADYRQALDRDPRSNDALRGLMNTYVAQEQTDSAIAAANLQIAKVQGSSGFYDLLGTVLFQQKKDLNGATAALTKATQLDKNNTDARIKLGQVQAADGHVDDAIATYQQGLKDNPQEASFYVLLGQLLQSRRDWNGATEAYQKALAIKPENPLASNDLASVMLQSGGNIDVALSLAQTARRGMPDSPSVADTLGWIYYQKGAYRSAVDSLREALKLGQESNSPDNPTFHYHLGMAYARSGQASLARQQLQQVLKLDPNSSDAKDARKQLAELKS